MVKRLFISIVAVFVAVAVNVQSASAIIDGERVSATYSWSVAFVEQDDGRPVNERVACSGVLIHERWVLTAYHCWDDIDGTNAVIGRKNLAVPGGDKQMVSEAQGSFFQGPGGFLAYHDVMLVKLPQETSQTPISLAEWGLAGYWNPGGTVRLYGYGCEVVGGASTQFLKRATFEILTFSPTGPIASGRGLNAPFGMALDGISGYSCPGDSGGPYITSTPYGPRVVGIHSHSNLDTAESPDQRTSIASKVGYRSSDTNSPLFLKIYETIFQNP